MPRCVGDRLRVGEVGSFAVQYSVPSSSSQFFMNRPSTS
jgi:hypothetical protein